MILDFELSSEFGETNVESGDSTVDVDLTATLAEDALREPVDSATVDLERTSFDSSLLDFGFRTRRQGRHQGRGQAALRPKWFPPTSTSGCLRQSGSLLMQAADRAASDLDLQQEVATKAGTGPCLRRDG